MAAHAPIRLSALLVVALLTACSSATVDRREAAAPTAPPAAAPQSTAELTPPVEAAPPAQPAASPPAPPVERPAPVPPVVGIGAPLALAPLNAEPITRRAVSDTPPGPVAPAAPLPVDPPLPTASADEIRLVQETLADQHLYRGPLDGQVTTEVRDAVRQYQRRKGLRETALLDPETLRRLDADASGSEAYGAGETGAKLGTGTGR